MAAMMTGSYIGGGVNFAAMAQSFGTDGDWVSALVVADNMLMALYFFVLLAIPSISFFRKKFSHPYIDEVEDQVDTEEGETLAAQYWGRKEISLKDIAFGVALCNSMGIKRNIRIFRSVILLKLFLNLINGFLGNEYLMITTITMLLATFAPNFMGNIHSKKLEPFNLYLPSCYRSTSIFKINYKRSLTLVFTGIIVLVNMVISLVLGKLFKFSLEEILVASNANIGGPTTAAAMAIAKGWNKLIGPIILAGILGYVIGNYLGIFMGNFLQLL